MTAELPAQAITSGFVAAPRPDLASAEIDGELVLYDDVTRLIHRLDRVATTLWLCLDGTSTLADIAADMADVYDADPARVLADVVSAARQLGSQGLLAGVAPDQEVAAQAGQVAAGGEHPADGAAGRRPEDGASGPFLPEPPNP